jgi:predicted dehydrogenase
LLELEEFAGAVQRRGVASFEAARQATGNQNRNGFEINGTKGSVRFNFERMNELEFYSVNDPEYAQGFRTILATEPVHPYITNWWPPGHIIGYEHEFVHAVYFKFGPGALKIMQGEDNVQEIYDKCFKPVQK